MSRFKFRAWDKTHRDMYEKVEGVAFYRYDIKDESKKEKFCGVTVTLRNGCPQFIPEEDLILMQSTGLHDKNGKEIFEGDIVHEDGIGNAEIVFMDKAWLDREYSEPDIIPAFLMKWHDESSSCSFIKKGTQVEIIGNIHENPELLTEAKE